jgi:signal transduction histidine kinase
MNTFENPTPHALIFSLNSEGILTMLHGAAAAATGWEIGQSVEVFGTDHEGLLPAALAAMQGEMTVVNLHLAGANYSLRVLPQPNGHPDSHGVIALTYDPGHSELDRLTNRFISMITHRFRNPLTVINTTTFLLERFDARLDADKKKEYFDKIRAQVGQLDEMIDQLLVVHGKSDHVFDPVWLDLPSLAQDVLNTTQPLTSSAHSLKLTTDGDLTFRGDPHLLTDILRHLLLNAVKFSPAGGEIHLHVRREAESICLEVEDHGLGIPQADQPRIGQVFFRAANATFVQGSGLGLRIATLYAEQHGGRLSFTSTEGQGSTFTVWLPVSLS